MRTHIAGNTGISQVSSENHRIVSRDEWVAERKTLLAHEKELTRLRDRIARECRALPWVRIDKNYVLHSGGNTGLTFAQSASSSSAITAGSVVNVPCPISAAGDTMVMVPSVAIVSHTFGDSGPSAIAAPERPSPVNASGSGAAVRANVRPAA